MTERQQTNLFIRGAQDYAALPEWLLFDFNVPSGAVRLWAVMYFMAFHHKNNLTLTQQTLVRWTGTSVSTIQRYLKRLEEVGALTIEQNWDGNLQKENTYYIEYVRRSVKDDVPDRSVKDDVATDQGEHNETPGRSGPSPVTDNSIVSKLEKEAGEIVVTQLGFSDVYITKEDAKRIWDEFEQKRWFTSPWDGISSIRRKAPSDFGIPDLREEEA